MIPDDAPAAAADLETQLAEARADGAAARAGRDEIVRERDDLKAHLARTAAEAEEARAALTAIAAERDALKQHLERSTAQTAQAKLERDRLATQLRAMTPTDDQAPTAAWRPAAPQVGSAISRPTEDLKLRIATDLDPDELRRRLEEWAPWRVEVEFSNGVKTSDLETMQPFTLYPLSKLMMLDGPIPLAQLAGGTALDIGFFAGYNAFHLAAAYDMQVDGIDNNPRNLGIARFLADVGGLPDVNFFLDDAETYRHPEHYDLVLHLGTLYHLPNPVHSLAVSAANLKPGGYLALETTCYTGGDPRLVKYIKDYFGDPTNWWALSKPVLEELLELQGFEGVAVVHEVDLAEVDPGLSRVIYVARRGGDAG